MDHKYQNEINEFQEHFSEFRDKRMVLYGIGRYTATLINGLQGFRIVGLMDKEPENVGKEVFGLPIIDMRKAEETADLVVINTSETYWDVIYNRIADMKIPVYYKNGDRAVKAENVRLANPYADMDRRILDQLIEKSDVISFDFYDTLFMRAVCNPGDVFRLLEQDVREFRITAKSFAETRNEAIKELQAAYSLDELYANIEKISRLPHAAVWKIKEKEIALEKKLLFPRMEILQALKQAVEKKKEVYVISDMYLPKAFYTDVLRANGIDIPESHILVSNVLRKSKADGSLWDYYFREIVKGRKALHVGDNRQADVQAPQRYGIRTVYVPCPWELMSTSSMGGMACRICGDYDSAIAGCILKRMFHNPYRMQGGNGNIEINNNRDMGYVVFGPVILTFLLWMDKKRKEDGVNRLVFMSRDGYFLKEDYEYLYHLLGRQPDCCYLAISRQLAMSAAVTSKKELLEYALMPYTGGIRELFEDRFGIEGVKEIQDKTTECYLEEYGPEIRRRLTIIRNNYLRYLSGKQLDNNSAIIDLGYYGNNQKYLNKLIDKQLRGYYFNANLSGQNENIGSQLMEACFQKKDDLTGAESQVLKRMIYIESVLTAPHGMIKEIDENGNFVCAKNGSNQTYFQDKIEINEGIKEFIRDYAEVFAGYDIPLNTEFADWYYGFCLGGGVEIADHVKQSFYNDNAMMNRIESMLFY